MKRIDKEQLRRKDMKDKFDLILKNKGIERAQIALLRWGDNNPWGYTLDDMERIVYGDEFVDTQIALREAKRKLKP